MLSDNEIGYLCSLVRMDLRKRQRGIDNFTAHPGQDPAKADQVLADFREKLEFRQHVYQILVTMQQEARIGECGLPGPCTEHGNCACDDIKPAAENERQ